MTKIEEERLHGKRKDFIKDPFDKIKISKGEISKIKGLEKRLKKLSDLKLKRIGFTVFTSSGQDEGFNICYRKDMPIEEIGTNKMFYEKKSPILNFKNKSIKWPYTGFVKGNSLGWCPMPIPKVIEALKKNHYSLNDFINRYAFDSDNS